jgi:hypothetical protein
MLAGVLEKFIESSKGSPDISWWNQMCQEEAASADLEASFLTGWLAVFNVFDSYGGWIFPMCGALYPQSVSEDRKVVPPKLTRKVSKSKSRRSITSVCGGFFLMK